MHCCVETYQAIPMPERERDPRSETFSGGAKIRDGKGIFRIRVYRVKSQPKARVSIRLAPRHPERRPEPRWMSGVPPKGMAVCLNWSASAAVMIRGAAMEGHLLLENAIAGCCRPARSLCAGASNEARGLHTRFDYGGTSAHIMPQNAPPAYPTWFPTSETPSEQGGASHLSLKFPAT